MYKYSPVTPPTAVRHRFCDGFDFLGGEKACGSWHDGLRLAEFDPRFISLYQNLYHKKADACGSGQRGMEGEVAGNP